MKKVEMMKAAIKVMKDELFGWKWTADENGLQWEYLNITFELRITTRKDGNTAVEFYNEESGVGVYVEQIGNPSNVWMIDNDLFYADVDSAIYNATRFMIRKANYLF